MAQNEAGKYIGITLLLVLSYNLCILQIGKEQQFSEINLLKNGASGEHSNFATIELCTNASETCLNMEPVEVAPYEATCSEQAQLSGNHQNIISYTIYGENKNYWNGFPEILNQAKTVFPNWLIRVYTDQPDHEILQKLAGKFSNLHICDTNSLPAQMKSLKEYPSMMWRYFSLGDSQVDTVLFRDSDSELLDRDYEAVQEWLMGTNKSLHVMRDHNKHKEPIMGGMWGARITPENRKKWKWLRNLMFSKAHRSSQERQLDQTLLKRTVWKVFRGDSMTHDSYFCKKFPGSSPFPTQRRQSKFVGAKDYFENADKEIQQCPKECRPIHHKDWIYC